MADLAVELADLNSNARELLSKYDGAFSKLDEETQNKILTLQTTADDLKAQIESLGLKFDDGVLVDKDGNPLRIKVADAVNDDEAVSFGQNKISFHQLSINGSQTVTDGNKISFRTMQSSSDNAIELVGGNGGTDIKINKSGVYKIDLTFLCNTGYTGKSGDGRIRINGSDYVGFYSFASDSGGYEKSSASCVANLKEGDILTFHSIDDQYWWGSTSGYTHSSLNITRIGDAK